MLPDAIDFLEEGDREGYVRILIAMAGADGTLVREETAAIEAAMGRALIPPGKRDLLRQELKSKQLCCWPGYTAFWTTSLVLGGSSG